MKLRRISWWKSLFISHLSRPAKDRPIYQVIRNCRCCRFVEIGLDTGLRARRILQIAGRYTPIDRVSYVGIDLFESRPACDGAALTLKSAYRTLHATGARIRLVPGDPVTAIGRIANEVLDVDVVIVSHGGDGPPLARLAPFLPRMLHADSLIFVEQPIEASGGLAFKIVRPDEVLALTRSVRTRRAA